MNRRRALLAACIAVAALFACAKDPAPAAADPLRPLTVDQVEARLAAHDGKTFVYDDNPKEVWARRHVPGATWLDSGNVTAAALPADRTATLIFYCYNET